MSDAALTHSDPAVEPVRRGSSDQNIRLELKGNFNRVVEFTSAVTAPHNVRRGK